MGKVLVACEESQAVCTAFRELGHEAYSCDILPCRIFDHQEWHIVTDCRELLWGYTNFYTQDGEIHDEIAAGAWDLIIAHPPCTYLTVTGNRWFDVERYGKKAVERERERAGRRVFYGVHENKCEARCNRKPRRLHEQAVQKAGSDYSTVSIRRPLQESDVLVAAKPAETRTDKNRGAGNLLLHIKRRESEIGQQMENDRISSFVGKGRTQEQDIPWDSQGDGRTMGQTDMNRTISELLRCAVSRDFKCDEDCAYRSGCAGVCEINRLALDAADELERNTLKYCVMQEDADVVYICPNCGQVIGIAFDDDDV